MRVPGLFVLGAANPQCDGVWRWGFGGQSGSDEAMRAGTLPDVVRGPVRRDCEVGCLLSPCGKTGGWRLSAPPGGSLTMLHLELGISSLHVVRRFLSCKPPSLWCFAEAARAGGGRACCRAGAASRVMSTQTPAAQGPGRSAAGRGVRGLEKHASSGSGGYWMGMGHAIVNWKKANMKACPAVLQKVDLRAVERDI